MSIVPAIYCCTSINVWNPWPGGRDRANKSHPVCAAKVTQHGRWWNHQENWHTWWAPTDATDRGDPFWWRSELTRCDAFAMQYGFFCWILVIIDRWLSGSEIWHWILILELHPQKVESYMISIWVEIIYADLYIPPRSINSCWSTSNPSNPGGQNCTRTVKGSAISFLKYCSRVLIFCIFLIISKRFFHHLHS